MAKTGPGQGEFTFGFDPIGFVESPFKDKYGIPRQPSLAPSARGKIKLKNDPDLVTALKTIDQFSHLWVVFVFHDHGGRNWKPSIRPPRLGGRQKVGVLASRSPHRPNPIGLSAVRIEGVNLLAEGGPEIAISGLDLLDQTPVLDVKPYIPYADAIPEATSGWATESVVKYPVTFAAEAEAFLQGLGDQQKQLSSVILEILEIDPRPAYQKRTYPLAVPAHQGLRYGIEIHGYEVSYEISGEGLRVLAIGPGGALRPER
jgi:tRNA-Thr(GGU) m(6)t(6)A37 methyltransferase TsaA